MESDKISRPMFTNRQLTSLAVPIILDGVLALVTGMADAAMVSSAGEAAVSGVSLVDAVLILLVVVFSALATGGVVITAQYLGSQDYRKAKISANQLLYATTAASLLIVAVTLGCIPQIIRLVYGELEPDVMAHAQGYFFYVLLGMPFLAIGSACMALLRAMSHSKLALMLAIGVNVVNIGGNALFIYGLDMGAAGAAIATTIARFVMAAVALWIMHNRGLPIYFEKLLKIRVDWGIMKKIMKVGFANGLESGLFQVGKLLVASLVASFGTVYIAANAVASNICNIGWTIISTMGTVLLTVVGQCIGADEPQQAKAYTKKFMFLSNIMSVVLFGGVFLLRNTLVQLYDFEAESLEVAAYYAGVGALLTISSCYGNVFVPSNAFRAAGDVRFAVILAVSSMFIFRVGLSYLLSYVFELGLLSVWLGMAADWVCRSIVNTWRFRGNKWLTKKLI